MINQKVIEEEKKSVKKNSSSTDSDDDGNGTSGSNKGKLIIDATCTLADITFPTDLKLLSIAREKSEAIIDLLHRPLRGKQKKPSS